MINQDSNYKGKWKFILIVPVISLIFIIFSMACDQTLQNEAGAEDKIEVSIADPEVVEFISINYKDIKGMDQVNFIVALMNKNSEIMIAGEKLPLDQAQEKVYSEYRNQMKEVSDIRVVVQKDLMADQEKYQVLIDAISTAQLKARNSYAKEQFGMDFDALADSEQQQVRERFPLRIYGLSPDKNMG